MHHDESVTVSMVWNLRSKIRVLRVCPWVTFCAVHEEEKISRLNKEIFIIFITRNSNILFTYTFFSSDQWLPGQRSALQLYLHTVISVQVIH